MEEELAAGGGGVDRLLEAAEPDPTLGEPFDGISWSRSWARTGRSVRAPLAVSVKTR
jgi:hypothetical protein